MNDVLKSPFGSVRPYTRHAAGCKLTDPNDNSCRCPKWLYVNERDKKPRRYTLNTPSFSEAVRIASDTLRGFDPEIAESRQQKKKKISERKTVEEAIDLWIERTRNLFGHDADIVKQYRSTFGWKTKDGKARGNLLLYVQQFNEENPDKTVEYIQDIDPLFCQQWHDSWKSKYAEDTRRQRWGTVRSFFSFLYNVGVIDSNPTMHIKAVKSTRLFAHVPFTDAQYGCLLEQADRYVDDRVKAGEKQVYCLRSRAFLELLRHAGMDVLDAVMFQPAAIEDEECDGKIVPVLRYRRRKTKVQAIIVLDPALSKSLRSIPLAPGCEEDRPFRYKGNLEKSDSHNWSRRIAQLIRTAKIGPVQLVDRDGTPAVNSRGKPITRNPNAKMLRHTFAVSKLVQGFTPEVVAKQLGHVDTEMIFRHYAPWVKERDLAHIRAQI